MRDKRIILAVTGSIAAYKAAFLTRLLVTQGCQVQVLMTPAAKAFVAPLTFATLSRRPVFSDVVDEDQWNNHVELGLWADAMVVAPATASTISKCTHGQSDNMVVATYLSARGPVFFAPAMDLDMWEHAATRDNLQALIARGDRIIPVGHGELASGLTGYGRMAEPEDIVEYLTKFFALKDQLAGKRALVTAGPTHEALDPVRFIGNPSTGKMGIAIAEALAARGAEVDLVLGPTHLRPQHVSNVHLVTSADEMCRASLERFEQADIAVLTAAVADYKPAAYSEHKIKKTDGDQSLQLVRTPDIAEQLGQRKRAGQIIIGFALETQDAEENARAKLRKKNFDMIVLNSLADQGAGFGHDTNKVKFIFTDNQERDFELKSKQAVASDIADAIAELINTSS
ncbi:MAG: bifunctional phosphopantothenoylcysteine decarboxylase/phosphopantothenate--cysteine ligase CoaBC [Saprospiraceae bacterium]|nr:bifunctional phosphopantothenoylcysteine decarboxylase/phosphopantothenate--cysteine ligase CoaBC [Saprospiraceae bacterium]